MRKPIVENVDKWVNHYKSMAEGKIPFEDMYILNQKGRGLGNKNKSQVICKIQKGNTPTIFSAQLVSPVAQGINQAESMVKKKKAVIKRKKTTKRCQSGKITKRKAPPKKGRKSSKKKTNSKKKKDIFG